MNCSVTVASAERSLNLRKNKCFRQRIVCNTSVSCTCILRQCLFAAVAIVGNVLLTEEEDWPVRKALACADWMIKSAISNVAQSTTKAVSGQEQKQEQESVLVCRP